MAYVSAQTHAIPSTDIYTKVENGKASLAGDWGFYWGDWIPTEELNSTFNKPLQTIKLPNYLTELSIPNTEKSQLVHGHGTYLLEITHLNKTFKRPSISMRHVSEAWQAWWVESSGEIEYLGQSGKISIDPDEQEFRDQTYILELPHNSQKGTLIIYISAHFFDRAGVYGDLVVTEHETAFRAVLSDLASRAFLIGIGIYVVIQNLVFFLQRPKEKVLLLLAVFALVGLMRAAFSSGYVDYFATNPSFTVFSLKFEYLLVIWPAVAGLQLLLQFFPVKNGRPLVISSYVILLLIAIVTIYISLSTMTLNLHIYQIILLVFTSICFVIIGNGLVKKMPDAKSLLISFIPLVLAVFNDIIAAKSPSYSFYVSEYALFFFLFIQTQIQASRFVSALDVAEHLTNNLQEEVKAKTRELSIRNALLEEKAEHLEEQHHQIKLLSETDHLTGLYNRQTLESHSDLQFQLAKTYDQPLSLVMMDLDHFKRINDKYGHLVGDECLVFTASYLRGFNLRKRDIIARYGGEELMILLTDTKIETAKEIIQSLCDGLKEIPVQGDHPDIYLTASFGIADINGCNATNIQELISCADEALYQAKQQGRDRVELFSSKSPETEA